ncbi:GNAT family N-acetyltransferase [Anaerocolumna sp. AGMB13020]|uniref:GNAT family N-acetyltransferase n=1 Tax=Anaerocolumna sp. AGMB13020 TaxID=3081750 RepID=UPI0029537724|nr:GNAT family N-acetyltransferase [Anaerocolumna sp. AGMB13020]WOO37705.1 GNAT family N-acetyltransferase [Anaerocolumna sp. AGMB13020]
MAGNITFRPMESQDIDELTRIAKRAFDEDSKMHTNNEEGGPEGYDDGSFLRKWGLHPDSTAFKIYRDEELIGGIVLWIKTDKHHFLGTIFLDAAEENKGVGTKVWQMVEEMYPDTLSWSTETPIFSRRNHNFYINKCGFHCVRIENPKDLEAGSFQLRKEMKR